MVFNRWENHPNLELMAFNGTTDLPFSPLEVRNRDDISDAIPSVTTMHIGLDDSDDLSIFDMIPPYGSILQHDLSHAFAESYANDYNPPPDWL